ncbi:MAG TPA: ATP-binding protein [Streptosporangiaceae bacterium]|nr:ATP-binding protein [Streptosporangiaceae bacterium]
MSAHISLRRRIQHPATGRALLTLATTALISGVGCLWAALAAPPGDRAFVAICLGAAAVLLCAAVAVAAYRTEEMRGLREQLAAKDESVARLADETLPAVVKHLRDGASADTALAAVPLPADGAQRRIVWTVAREVGHGERMRVATMSACANAAGRVQALATSMLAELREMEERHDEEVLGDLLKLDHSTAQAGRLADSIAVLTGARSGRRWTKPIVMESILRGAMGRIGAYQRVRIHSTINVAVVGYAAEGVMHALAELMDNAAKFSPPSEQVHVYAEEVHAGVVIMVEDGGLAMGDAALRRAERAVSPAPLDFGTLTGTRLGLAVVGCLARKYGLTVSFRPSSRGGTGVVLMIPRQLITEPRDDVAPGETGDRAAEPARADGPGHAGGPDHAGGQAGEAAADEAHGLPKRRRGQTLAAAARSAADRSAADRSAAASPARTRPDAGSRFSAFRQGSRAGKRDDADGSTDSE